MQRAPQMRDDIASPYGPERKERTKPKKQQKRTISQFVGFYCH